MVAEKLNERRVKQKKKITNSCLVAEKISERRVKSTKITKEKAQDSKTPIDTLNFVSKQPN